MSENRMSRKELFLVAISRSPFRSAAEFARSVGVSRTHLYLVMDGTRESQTLTAKIDALITEYVGADAQPPSLVSTAARA